MGLSARGRVGQARAAFEAELASNETAEALDGLARTRWWLSDISGAVEAWDRAYTAYRRAGLDESAAHVAVLLSREHGEGLGNQALANGWLARAKDLLAPHPDSLEWGWVALVESERAVDPTLPWPTPSVHWPWPGEPETPIWSWLRWVAPDWPRSRWAESRRV